jgi:predicted phosphodiesterase
MALEDRIAILSDIHGEHRVLRHALERCRESKVRGIVLLGDIFDRVDQIDRCLRYLESWRVNGVLGNHDREALIEYRAREGRYPGSASTLFKGFRDRIQIGDAVFVHDEMDWRRVSVDWAPAPDHVRIIFAGHTHVRRARDERGPIDLSLGKIDIRGDRQYVINPGAVVEGQFAIWDRNRSHVTFERV